MITDREFTLDAMRSYGRARAENIQEGSAMMTGTDLNEQDGYIPDFIEACAAKNMLERKAGMADGFVCKSSCGRVVRLLQKYDSAVFTAEPEDLPAQWGFVWSHNPNKAKPFIAVATSPYMVGDCCSVEVEGDDGTVVFQVYRSKYDNNVHSPVDWPIGWEIVE